MKRMFHTWCPRRVGRLSLGCLIGIVMAARPGTAVTGLSLDGLGEVNWYPRLKDPAKPVINRQKLRLNVVGERRRFRFRAWTEARRNGSGELRPEWEFLVPEVYCEYRGGSVFVRAGKQQIVWGEADGLFINDVVNPLDLREFLLPELEDIRMGQPSLRVILHRAQWELEGVWLLRFAETRLPAVMKNALSQEIPFPVTIRDPEKPPHTLGDTEFGFRVSGVLGHWDVALNYLMSWRDIPTYRGAVTLAEGTGAPHLVLTPFHQRISTWGGNFSRPLGPVLFRGEFSCVPGLYFETTDPGAESMLVERNFFTYFLGVDFRVRRTRIGVQFAQELISGDTGTLNRDDTDNVATVLVERYFLHDSVQFLVFADREFTQRDLWIRTEIGYRVRDNVRVTLGSHVFTGRESGRLGRFHDWNCLILKARYSFSVE